MRSAGAAPPSCKHDWAINNDWDGGPAPYPIIQCIRCNEVSAGAAPLDVDHVAETMHAQKLHHLGNPCDSCREEARWFAAEYDRRMARIDRPSLDMELLVQALEEDFMDPEERNERFEAGERHAEHAARAVEHDTKVRPARRKTTDNQRIA